MVSIFQPKDLISRIANHRISNPNIFQGASILKDPEDLSNLAGSGQFSISRTSKQ